MMKKAVSFLMILIMLFTACTALADDSFNVNKDGYSTSYTYRVIILIVYRIIKFSITSIV